MILLSANILGGKLFTGVSLRLYSFTSLREKKSVNVIYRNPGFTAIFTGKTSPLHDVFHTIILNIFKSGNRYRNTFRNSRSTTVV